MNRPAPRPLCMFVLLCAALLLAACSSPTVVAPVEATVAPPTATTAPTNTPEPTSTATPEPTATATATITPTRTATPNIQATAAARKTATAVAQIDLIRPTFKKLDLDPESGRLVWYGKEKINLEVRDYNSEVFVPLEDVGIIDDFVLRTKITWDSTGGLAGCSINFRAEEDPEYGAHYAFHTMRLQQAPAWDVEYHKFNQWQSTLTNRIIFTNHLIDGKGTTNEIVLIVRGKEMQTYINGEKQRNVTLSKLTEGYIQFLVWQDSGKTSCVFHDSWVWQPEKEGE
jgi:hypothetical protein